MDAAAATNQLSYKELQAALRTAKEQGLTGIKLNSKMEVLQEEYNRITNKTVDSNSSKLAPTSNFKPLTYPFCSNTVKVENKPTVERSETTVNELYTTRVLPAMNSKYAPSWLCKPYTVYVIDGIEYLSHELEMQLTGQVCELPAVTNERKLAANQPPRLQQPARKDRVSKARPAVPIVNPAKELPKVACNYSKEPASPYFIDTSKAARYLNVVKEYSKSLGDVEKQAARNLEDGIKYATSATKRVVGAVIDFSKGFHARQVERAVKVA